MAVYTRIFFDLDGTLTDSKDGIVRAVQYALAKEGLPEFDEQRIVEHIGGPLREVICKHFGMDEQAAARLISGFRDYYGRIGIYESRLFPGVVRLLQKLRTHGARLGLATAKPTRSAHVVLDVFGIADLFDAVAGSDVAAGLRSKSEILAHCLESTRRADGDRAVMVGDRRYDIEAAGQCRIDSIGAGYGYGSPGELESAGANRIATTVEALEAILLER